MQGVRPRRGASSAESAPRHALQMAAADSATVYPTRLEAAAAWAAIGFPACGQVKGEEEEYVAWARRPDRASPRTWGRARLSASCS